MRSLQSSTRAGLALVKAAVVLALANLAFGRPVAFGQFPAATANAPDVEKPTRDWIKTLGPSASAYGQPITSVGLENARVTDKDLKRIAKLDHLQWLQLGRTAVTDAGLKELAGLKHLGSLLLARTAVTDAGLKELAGVKILEYIDLSGTRVTDAGLRELAGLEKLQGLALGNTKVTSAGLKELGRIKSLRSLRLDGAVASGASTKDLSELRRVNTLGFDRGEITDRMLRALREAGLLQALAEAETGDWPSNDNTREAIASRRPARAEDVGVLELRGCPVTDAGLKELAGLKNLRYLGLHQTRVSAAGIQALTGLKRLHCLRLDEISDETLRTLHEAGLLHALATATKDPAPSNAASKTLTTPPATPPSGRPSREEDVTHLDLSGSKVTDAGLVELADLKNLRDLYLGQTQVTGEGFQHLSGLTKLQTLDLRESKVTDAGLKALRTFQNLEYLNLFATGVSDAGLKELAGLKNLRNLTVRSTRVTETGLREYAGIGSRTAALPTKGELLLTTAPGLPSGYQIFRVNADGSGRTQLTVGETGAADPASSPDGKRIAFVADARLCVSNADGAQRQSISEPADLQTLAPAWSPDGKRIAFTLFFRAGVAGSFKTRMYVVDADGRSLRPLGGIDRALPAWSPDGQRILFTRMSAEGVGLCVMNLSGANERVLVQDAMMGVWSPDGKYLAYVVVKPEAAGLYVAQADGSTPRRVASNAGAEALLGPQWSADGKRLFFTGQGKRGAASVHVVDRDGRNPRKVTAEGTSESLGQAFVWGNLLFR